MGDFNDMLSAEDKRGVSLRPNWMIRGFRQVVQDCMLIDLPMEGHPFTWTKGRRALNPTEERLDRALATQSWLDEFPQFKFINATADRSDHTPILSVHRTLLLTGLYCFMSLILSVHRTLLASVHTQDFTAFRLHYFCFPADLSHPQSDCLAFQTLTSISFITLHHNILQFSSVKKWCILYLSLFHRQIKTKTSSKSSFSFLSPVEET
ncbi:hypothetical protein QL285_016251 [Trifolium repens]|nr:hypothetical protein QL285_016251 [Trifolium repens]